MSLSIQASTNFFDQVHTFQEEIKSRSQTHPIDDKRLLLMLGDTFIKNTPYEGGNPASTYKYWSTVLQEMRDGKSIIAHSFTKEQIDSVLADLDNCMEADRLFDANESTSDENNGDALRTADMQKLLGLIETSLNNGSRRFVLPLQHCGLHGKKGHVFCAILEKKSNGDVICTLLNKGEGSELHRIVSISNKIKRSYRFEPIKLHDPNMLSPDSEMGLLFFNLLQQYRNSTCDYRGAFKSKEIYNLFLQAGTMLDASTTLDEDSEVTSQRSGTCSEQVVRLLIRDSLKNVPDKHLYKKGIFAAKFQVLLDGYQSHIEPGLLHKACEEFALSVLKLREAGFITQEEWINSYALIDLIRTERAYALKKVPVGHSLPPLVQEIKPEETYDFSDLVAISPAAHVKSERIVEPPILFKVPMPEELLSFLQDTEGKIEKNKSFVQGYYQVVHLVRVLPIPVLENDSYWDKIAFKEIPEILNILYHLFIGHIGTNSWEDDWNGLKKKDYKDLLFTHLSLFVIYDKLCRKLPELKLESFRFSFNRFDKWPERDGYHFQQGKDIKRLEAINKYLDELERKHPYSIYRIGQTSFEDLDVHDFIDKPQDPTLQHLKFIAQFVKPKLGECSHAIFLKNVLDWAGGEINGINNIPSYIQNLQKLSHHSYAMTMYAWRFANDIPEVFRHSYYPKKLLEFWYKDQRRKATALLQYLTLVCGIINWKDLIV